MIVGKMKWETFTEFCNRAIEIRGLFAINSETSSFILKQYRDYVYSHTYGSTLDTTINNKCWEWILSLAYEPMKLNDLYSLLGALRRGI